MTVELEFGDFFEGFEAYQNTDPDDLRKVLTQGIIALDTNVLLDLYRYGKAAREQVLNVLKAIPGSLFLPAQVQSEFWRNRDRVLRELAASSSVAGLREAKNKALNELGSWGDRTMATTESAALQKKIEGLFNEAIATVKSGGSGLSFQAALADVKDDVVVSRLTELFAGRVGKPFTPEVHAELVARGLERFAKAVPPGYCDATKADQSELGTGDYLMWEQLIRVAANQDKDVLLVTRDVKEDWWRLDTANEPVGPRAELIAEMEKRAGVRFFLARPHDLLEFAAEEFKIDVDESTLDTADRLVGETVEPSQGWTRNGFNLLLARLDETDNPVQAAVLREAARDSRGFISRARVYEIGEYPAKRSLTGFTKPVVNATRDLVTSGDLPAGLAAALRARYIKPGKAIGFEVARSIVDAISNEPPAT